MIGNLVHFCLSPCFKKYPFYFNKVTDRILMEKSEYFLGVELLAGQKSHLLYLMSEQTEMIYRDLR